MKPHVAVFEAYDGSRVSVAQRMELNSMDGAHSSNDMDWNAPIFYLAKAAATINTPTDYILFNGQFTTAVMSNNSALNLYPTTAGGGTWRPIFWKQSGSKTIQGVSVPTYAYPNVVQSETTVGQAQKFYPAIEFRGLYNGVNFFPSSTDDINLEYNLLGNYLRHDRDLGYPGANNETLSSVGLAAPVYNYIEHPVYKRLSDGILSSYSNGNPRYVIARHTNEDIFVDGASTRQATPTANFQLL
jgi:hypothetical protein